MSLIDAVALAVIRVYQKHVSPRKGFSCAYARAHQRGSCSQRVSDIIKQDGLFRGAARIRRQFRACGEAAAYLRGNQYADLDCSLGGCLDVGGPSGCFGGVGDSVTGRSGAQCVGAVDCLWPFGGRSRRRDSVIWLSLFAVCLGAGYFLHGSRVEGVEIQLIESSTEDRDRKWGLVANSELPDYQIIATINGQKVESTIAHNQSAEEWVQVHFPKSYPLAELDQFQITNRQLLNAKVLDEILSPAASGEGNTYRYRMIRVWSL